MSATIRYLMGEFPTVPPSELDAETIMDGKFVIVNVGRLALSDNVPSAINEGSAKVSFPEIKSANYEGIQPLSGKYPSPYVDQCRSLVAKRYLDEGYVTEDDLNENGHLNEAIDPYVEHSKYFWKEKEGRVIATLRIIHPPHGAAPLPIEKSFNLFPKQQTALNQVRANRPNSVVEISALAKADGVDKRAAFDMYKAVWQHAKRTGLELCAISADVRQHHMLIETLGESMEVAGEPSVMMGSLTVPSLLHPNWCARAVSAIYQQKVESGKPIVARAYKSLISYLINGLEACHLSSEEIAAFESMGLAPTMETLTK